MSKLYTVEEIRHNVMHNARWTEHALVALFARQTDSEQRTDSTHVSNGRGFAMNDASFLSSLAKHVRNGRSLTEKQLHFARYHRSGKPRIAKYAGQLFDIQNEKHAAAQRNENRAVAINSALLARRSNGNVYRLTGY
jgi:hypothetical protein